MITSDASSRPKLCKGVRIAMVSGSRKTLLYPEGILLLEESAWAVLSLCDGTRTLSTILQELLSTHPEAPAEKIRLDVMRLLTELWNRRIVTT